MERPDCTKPGKSLSYRMTDSKGKQVDVSVAGYCLRPEALYRIEVSSNSPNQEVQNIRLGATDEVKHEQEQGRRKPNELAFRVVRPSKTSILKLVQLISHVEIHFTIADQPQMLLIPILLLDTHKRAFFGILGNLGIIWFFASLLVGAITFIASPNVGRPFKTILTVGIILCIGPIIVAVLYYLEFRMLTRRADEVRRGIFTELENEGT